MAQRRSTRKRPGKNRRIPPAGRPSTPLDEALTPAQRRFALEYLANGFNARRAYLAAHPNVKLNTADVEGHRTLRTPKVRAWLNERLDDAWRPLQMGGEQALARVAVLASADVRDLYDENGELLAIHLWPDSIAACVKSIKDGPAGLTVTMHDKLAALRTILEQLGKLKTPGDSMDALADAIRADRKTHGIDE